MEINQKDMKEAKEQYRAQFVELLSARQTATIILVGGGKSVDESAEILDEIETGVRENICPEMNRINELLDACGGDITSVLMEMMDEMENEL